MLCSAAYKIKMQAVEKLLIMRKSNPQVRIHWIAMSPSSQNTYLPTPHAISFSLPQLFLHLSNNINVHFWTYLIGSEVDNWFVLSQTEVSIRFFHNESDKNQCISGS